VLAILTSRKGTWGIIAMKWNKMHMLGLDLSRDFPASCFGGMDADLKACHQYSNIRLHSKNSSCSAQLSSMLRLDRLSANDIMYH
jgi:hypothetical protein